MLLARSAAVLALSLLLVSGAGAATRAESTSLAAPTSLHALLRADELSANTFSRTPAFAWRPVKGASRYLFRVGTSTAPAPNAVWWSGETSVPAISLPVALPWITGEPYSLYAQVRGIGTDGSKGPWSKPFGFDMRWILDSGAGGRAGGTDSLDDGRRRDRIRGLVPRRGTARPHEHERRRRARVLRA